MPEPQEQELALQRLRDCRVVLEDLALLFNGRMNTAIRVEERDDAEDVNVQLDRAVRSLSEGTNLSTSLHDKSEQQRAGELNTRKQETERVMFRHFRRARGVLEDLEYLYTGKVESAKTTEEKDDAEHILFELRMALSTLMEGWYWLGGHDME